MSMSCTARSMTTPTSPMRGGKGPTRVIWIEMMSSPSMARLTASTAGLKRSTWPTISTRLLARAASIMRWASATVAAMGFSTNTWTPASSRATPRSAWCRLGVATTAASRPAATKASAVVTAVAP